MVYYQPLFYFCKMNRIKQLYEQFILNPIVTTDSRICQSGSIFFALKGGSFDGNLYALDALKKGCRLAVVDDASLKNEKHIFFVDDVLIALQQLANYHRTCLNIPIIGITGSNGKTTSKELIVAVLKKKYNVFYTQGNLNNHIGVPLTLLSMNSSTEIGVVEMGANHLKEIEELCNIADPDFGLITNIGKAHIEGFGSEEGIRVTKGELYDHVSAKGGVLFVNAGSAILMNMSTQCKRVLYSQFDCESKVYAANIEVDLFLNFKCNIRNEEKVSLDIETKLIGSYNVENVLAAIAIGNYFKVDNHDIVDGIRMYSPSNNRSQMVKTQRNTLLLDAYNANPSSMKVALENFELLKADKKIVVLGEMKEMGAISFEEHLNLVNWAKSHRGVKSIFIGNEFSKHIQNGEFDWFVNVDDLIKYLSNNSLVGYHILIKGSRSNQLERIKDYL